MIHKSIIVSSEEIGEIVSGNHLHFEMWIRDCTNGCLWYLVDPLNNPYPDYQNPPPGYNDIYDVELNDIILEPADSNSGIIFTPGNGLAAWYFNSCKIHKKNRPDSQGPIHNYNSSPITVFGNILPTVHVRDTEVTNGTNSTGEGLGIYECLYFINDEIKYWVRFDELEQIYKPNWATFFNHKYNTAANQSVLYGNHDYIKLHRLTTDQYSAPHQVIDRGIWKTRVKIGSVNEMADCPMEVQYNDGIYEVDFSVLDAAGNRGDASNKIKVDNFQPFIQEVSAQIGWHDIYHKVWECEDNCSGNTGGISLINPLPNPECPASIFGWFNTIEVNVVSSEPLEELQLDVPALVAFNLQPTYVSSERTNWTFEVPYILSQLAGVNSIYFYFTGTDQSGNALLNLSSFAQATCTVLPTRQASGWSTNNIPTGTDQTHYFVLSCGKNRPGRRSNEETVLTIVPDENCIEVNYTVTPASGPFVADGTIVLEPPTGGLPPYTYEWDNGATTSSLSGILPGFYCVQVSDAFCCEKEICIEVGFDCELQIDNLIPICICEWGSAELEVSGGSGNYSYAWTSSEFPGWVYSNEEVPTILPPSFGSGPYNHTVTVTDNETGCQATTSTEVGYCNGIDLASFIEVTPDCNEEGTSTISVKLPPNTALGPFEFRWTKAGVGLVEFDPSQDGLASLENAGPGEYCLNLRTMNGCEETVCGIMVESMPAPTVTYDISPIGGSNWTLSTEVTGGSGTYSYLWSDDNGSTTPSITVQEIDDYYVTVTDVTSSCTAIAVIEMVSCNEIEQALYPPNEIEVQVTPISSGGNLGAINILNVADQFPGYHFNYIWSNGETQEDIYDLTSGFYWVTVTLEDCNFLWTGGPWEVCGFSVDFEVYPFLNNCDLADLRLNVSPPDNYSYQWNDPAQSQTANISAQYGINYCVTISIGNAPNNCDAVACITPEPPPIEIELVNLEHALYGLPTGLIEVDASVGPYTGLYELTYNWSNGNEGPVNQNLYPGEYTVTVSDNCGNTATATYNIQCELLESDIEAVVTDVPCSSNTIGSNTGGSITLTELPFSNGNNNPVYSFSWSNGATTQNISNLAAGEYCVTIVMGSHFPNLSPATKTLVNNFLDKYGFEDERL